MINFNAGALGPSGAQDLVRETLSRHGLWREDMAGQASPEPGDGLRRHTCAAGTRAYRLCLPSRAQSGLRGMVVMLHGCTQSAADFARGTGMDALAEAHNFAVLYPEQSRGDNAQSCWNWFDAADQSAARGEPAILAHMTRAVAAEQGVPQGRIFVAGLSAGAAMAVILGQTHPELFAAVGAHSGLPFGAAQDMAQAFAAMAGQGAAPTTARAATPTIVFHGGKDSTVRPINGERIAAQVIGAVGQSIETQAQGPGGAVVRQVSDADGAPICEYWSVPGLGHAWSGGQAGGSHTDPTGPDASAQMVRFFYDVDRGRFAAPTG